MGILLIITPITGLLIWLYNRQKPLESVFVEEDNKESTMEERGREGEEEISAILQHLPGKFLLYNNLYLPTGPNSWTEIDAVIVHEKAIFVFESKNYSGEISGKTTDRYWLKSYSSTYNQRFYNPIMQNATHIHALQQIIGQQIPLYSIIVFGRDTELFVEQMPANDVYICKVTQLKFLWDLLATLERSIDLEYIQAKITQFEESDWSIKQQHIENIQKKYGNKAIS